MYIVVKINQMSFDIDNDIDRWGGGCLKLSITITKLIFTLMINLVSNTLKQKKSHFDYSVFTGCTWGDHHDHSKCIQWLQISQCDYFSVVALLTHLI